MITDKSYRNNGTDKQEVLATLGIYALEKHNLKSIMDRAINLSCIVLDLDCAVIFAFNKQENTLQIEAQAGCAAEKDPIEIKEKWDIGYAINQEEPTVVESYREDERFRISPFLADQDIQSSINITVRGSEDTYGLLGFYSEKKRVFADHEVSFLQIVANIVGMAIERDYHKQHLRDKNEQLRDEMKRSRKFQREILKNSVSQRWELGSFLHDNLAQLLASAKIVVSDIKEQLSGGDKNIDLSDELTELNKMIDEGISGIRNLTQYIIPIDLEKEGVAHAYRFLMQQTQKLYNINCRLKTGTVIHQIQNIEVATNLYHIIQEAVKNAAVHGKAEYVTVILTKSDNELIIRIEDDGLGLSNAGRDHEGRGIQIMRHRMELMNGTFDIEEISDSERSGTMVTCTIPLESATKKSD